jgi:hypothetical protein
VSCKYTKTLFGKKKNECESKVVATLANIEVVRKHMTSQMLIKRFCFIGAASPISTS